jgi:hypothetical protein
VTLWRHGAIVNPTKRGTPVSQIDKRAVQFGWRRTLKLRDISKMASFSEAVEPIFYASTPPFASRSTSDGTATVT